MKKKILYAKPKALLSLQFYRDKDHTPNFLITSNPEQEGRDIFTGIDRLIFAQNLTESPLVSAGELIFLCDFFDAVRRELSRKIVKTS